MGEPNNVAANGAVIVAGANIAIGPSHQLVASLSGKPLIVAKKRKKVMGRKPSTKSKLEFKEEKV